MEPATPLTVTVSDGRPGPVSIPPTARVHPAFTRPVCQMAQRHGPEIIQRAETEQSGPNPAHRNDPRLDTADFAEPPGSIRADYVLPSPDLRITGAEVLWPESTDPLAALTGSDPLPSSDRRLVFVDVRD